MTPRGAKFLRKLGNSGSSAFGIVGQLRLFLGVEVVEVAVEFVETVGGRQHFVAVAQMVLAELTGGVALRLQHFGDGRIFLAQPQFGAGQADLAEAGAEYALTRDEGGPAGGAALLAVIIGEDHAILGDGIDIGRAIAHEAVRVGAEIALADVVAPDDDDVRLLGVGGRGMNRHRHSNSGYHPKHVFGRQALSHCHHLRV